ncbi:hypothetical protein CC2G_007130 [Coprinopsis cinerea AmutBmut pab1-1]|nr:hypothetical protein CC2G_007130 [Coprinopsis cinerea AmutBmut pab1-1]
MQANLDRQNAPHISSGQVNYPPCSIDKTVVVDLSIHLSASYLTSFLCSTTTRRAVIRTKRGCQRDGGRSRYSSSQSSVSHRNQINHRLLTTARYVNQTTTAVILCKTIKMKGNIGAVNRVLGISGKELRTFQESCVASTTMHLDLAHTASSQPDRVDQALQKVIAGNANISIDWEKHACQDAVRRYLCEVHSRQRQKAGVTPGTRKDRDRIPKASISATSKNKNGASPNSRRSSQSVGSFVTPVTPSPTRRQTCRVQDIAPLFSHTEVKREEGLLRKTKRSSSLTPSLFITSSSGRRYRPASARLSSRSLSPVVDRIQGLLDSMAPALSWLHPALYKYGFSDDAALEIIAQQDRERVTRIVLDFQRDFNDDNSNSRQMTGAHVSLNTET